jgi:hypothetical protein
MINKFHLFSLCSISSDGLVHVSGVARDLRITACDENETKLNMPLFRLSIIMTFVQDNPCHPFNPIGENRP